MHYPVTADEAANPAASEWLVPLVFPLETCQYWGYLVASRKVGAASSRENPESGDGAACKWQHTDTLMIMFPVCHPLLCTETKQMSHFPPKLSCLFLCKDRIRNKRIAKTESVCGWRIWIWGVILWLKLSCHKHSCRINGKKSNLKERYWSSSEVLRRRQTCISLSPSSTTNLVYLHSFSLS